MYRQIILFFVAAVFIISSSQVSAQTKQNPKLSKKDLEAAQSITRESGGANSELIYAARLDAVQEGAFDSLVVIYARNIKGGKDIYALVSREGQNYPLIFDKEGRALKSGDKFLSIGRKAVPGKPPLLRIMGGVTEPAKGEMQRNLDFQFKGNGFALIDQSMTLLPR